MSEEGDALTQWEAVLVRLSCTLWHHLHSARDIFAVLHVDPDAVNYDALVSRVMDTVVQDQSAGPPPKRPRTEPDPPVDPAPWKGSGGVDAYLVKHLGLVKPPRYDEIDGLLARRLPEARQQKSLRLLLKRWYIHVWDSERGSAVMEVDPYSGPFEEVKTRDLIQNLARVPLLSLGRGGSPTAHPRGPKPPFSTIHLIR